MHAWVWSVQYVQSTCYVLNMIACLNDDINIDQEVSQCMITHMHIKTACGYDHRTRVCNGQLNNLNFVLHATSNTVNYICAIGGGTDRQTEPNTMSH